MKIGLCTPNRLGTVHHQHMFSLIDTLRLASQRSIEVVPYNGPGCAILPRVRNRLVANALADKCDWIIFVDDDIAWNAPDFFKLTEHGVEVVGGVGAKRHQRWDEEPGVVMQWPQGPLIGAFTKPGRLWRVDGAGAGFLGIRADVFAKMEPVTRRYTCQGDPKTYPMRTWFWLDLLPGDGEVMEDEGEDYNFCRKWREIGGHCWIDPDIRLRHYDGNVCHDRCPADMETTKAEAA
jgi:glycosyltransferase involved in cell wall biosynthesis